MKTQYTRFFLAPRGVRDVRFISLLPPSLLPSLTALLSHPLHLPRAFDGVEYADTFVIIAIASIGQSANGLMSHGGNYRRATQDDVRSFAKRVTTATVGLSVSLR